MGGSNFVSSRPSEQGALGGGRGRVSAGGGPSIWRFALSEEPLRHQGQYVLFVRAMAEHNPSDLAVNLGDSRKFLFRKVQQILNKAVSTGPAISVNAPYGSEHVSFQKVVVPLLATLVKPEVANHPDTRVINTVFATLDATPGLKPYLIQCALRLSGSWSRSLAQSRASTSSGIAELPAWVGLLEPVLRFYGETLQRLGPSHKLEQTSRELRELRNALEGFQRRDPVRPQHLELLSSRLRSMERSVEVVVHRDDAKRRAREERDRFRSIFPIPRSRHGAAEYDGPGELSRSGQPRHDNDHEDISRISVAPTGQEILSLRNPYLPRNSPDERHHLPEGSAARHLDIIFRLLRHDLLAPLLSRAFAVQSYLAARYSEASAQGSQWLPGSRMVLPSAREGGIPDPDAALGLGPDPGSMEAIVGVEAAEQAVFVLRNVAVVGLDAGPWGWSFQIEFDTPAGRSSHLQGESYWQRSKRLMPGSLVCLWRLPGSPQSLAGAETRVGAAGGAGLGAVDSGQKLMFATVVGQRDAKALAGKGGRSQLGVRPCAKDPALWEELVASLMGLGQGPGQGQPGAAGQGGQGRRKGKGKGGGEEHRGSGKQGRGGNGPVAGEMVLLEAHGSFFAYEPILKALQRITETSLPFAGLICGTGGIVGLPGYMRPDTRLDLAPLLNKSDSDPNGPDSPTMPPTLSVTPAVPRSFPTREVMALSTLDEPQCAAVEAALTQELALIQGPPGTGKTFLGVKIVQLLLHNAAALGPPRVFPGTRTGGGDGNGSRNEPTLGPILCVCYTNHALDQFLEGLLDAGITKIVRAGGQCKSERLQPFHLKEIYKAKENIDRSRTMMERKRGTGTVVYDLAKKVKEQGRLIKQRRQHFLKVPWEAVEDLLQLDYPWFYKALAPPDTLADADGFTSVSAPSWERWLAGKPRIKMARRKEKAQRWREDMQDPRVGASSWVASGASHSRGAHSGSSAHNPFAALTRGGPWSDMWDELGGDETEDEDKDGKGERGTLQGPEGDSGALASQLSALNLGHGKAPAKDQTGSASSPQGRLSQEDEDSEEDEDEEEMLQYLDLESDEALAYPWDTASSPRGRESERRGKGSSRDLDELVHVRDVWELSRQERMKLVAVWCQSLDGAAGGELKEDLRQLETALGEFQAAKEAEQLQILKGAQVLGMTTSGVAMNQTLVTALGPRVVLVEEAAEVLEAHILTSLAPTTQHLILIGDHLQLRPKVEVYELSRDSGKGYDLDVSLFERLVQPPVHQPQPGVLGGVLQQAARGAGQRDGEGRVPVHTLSTQRRMRPEIAELVRRTVYPRLQDHPSVGLYPPVRGMDCNLFFWDHSFPESGEGPDALTENKSKANPQEAAMVAALARYLLQQGYGGGEVTVLTPYVGQLLLLKRALGDMAPVVLSERDLDDLAAQGMEDVEDASPVAVKDAIRLATVDNFQGEESTVVIISMVRSNYRGTIGFLKSPNRSNVMLSRAKHGLYIIGNAETLTSSARSPMWAEIMRHLQARGRVSPTLRLRCQQHPEEVTEVKDGGELQAKAGDGGCAQSCGFRLSCGHTCPRRCHPDDRGHTATQCWKPCMRMRPASECPRLHPCPKACGEDCGPCMVLEDTLELPCGHLATSVPCHVAQKPEAFRCREVVEITMEACSHKQQVECWKADRRRSTPEECTGKCGVLLADSCGHACAAKCGDCYGRWKRVNRHPGAPGAPESGTTLGAPRPGPSSSNHLPCHLKCDATLFCGHLCPEPCHSGRDCPPCSQDCLVSCAHSRCNQPCSQVCFPCAEPCLWSCPHRGPCKVPCGAPCSRLPCDMRCEATLACGHRCPSLCGEPCPAPSSCPDCARILVEQKLAQAGQGLWVDAITMETLEDVNADEDPLLTLPCGHMFTVTTLDGHMGLGDVYQQCTSGVDSVGEGSGSTEGWDRPVELSTGFSTLKGCIHCREPILGVRRYGRLVSKAFLDQVERKFIQQVRQGAATASLELSELADSIRQLGTPVAGDGGKGQPDPLPLRDRNRNGMVRVKKIRKELAALTKSLTKTRSLCQNPPGRQVYSAALAAVSREAAAQWGPPETPEVIARRTGMLPPEPDLGPWCQVSLGLVKARRLKVALLLKEVSFMPGEDGLLQASGMGRDFQEDGLRDPPRELHRDPQRDVPRENFGAEQGFLARLRDVLGHRHGHEHAAGQAAQADTGHGDAAASQEVQGEAEKVMRSALAQFRSALGLAQEVAEAAEKRQMGRQQAQAAMAKADVYLALVSEVLALRKEGLPPGTDIPEVSREALKQHLDAASRELTGVAHHHLVSVRKGNHLGLAARTMLEADIPALLRAVEMGDFYQVVTEREKREVIEAMGMGRGHWYRCPNGHVYTIGECGGAMQESVCPECGERIGGRSHVLVSTNETDHEFERLVAM